MKKTQIFIIHGGEIFKTQKEYLRYLKTRKISTKPFISWSNEYLMKELGKKFEIIKPRMPLQDNARYSDWKIHFERHFPYLKNSIILIGTSLGGIFLAKYLSENKFPKKILSVYLVCPPFDALPGGFKLKSNLARLQKNCNKLTLFFSKDDKVVPISQAAKYAKKLKKAKIIIYKSKNGHFRISKFPEIIKKIKSDTR